MVSYWALCLPDYLAHKLLRILLFSRTTLLKERQDCGHTLLQLAFMWVLETHTVIVILKWQVLY